MDDPFPDIMMPNIRKFFESEHTRKPGQDIYPEVFSTPAFFPLQRQRELAYMMATARVISPKVVFEIGSDKGGGLYHWCKSIETVTRVIACEIRGTPYRDLFEQAFPDIDFLWLDGVSSYSTESVTRVVDWLGEDTINCLFIDGDKSAFEIDFHAYLPSMSSNGRVFMHDVQDGPCRQQFDRCAEGLLSSVYLNKEDYQDSIRRGGPPINSHDGWLRHWKGQSCGVGVIRLCEQS